MTANLPSGSVPRKEAWRLGLWAMVRVLVTVTLLITAYYLVPTPDAGSDSDLPWLLFSLTIFGVIVGIQIPAIVNSKYPNLRAAEAMSVTVPFYLLIFARIYLSNALGNPGAFSEQLDHTKSLYFTITVFATVGFGDITPETNPMRLLVSAQMLLNLVVIGLVVRLLLGAAQRGVTKKRESVSESAVQTSASQDQKDQRGMPPAGGSESADRHGSAPESPADGSPHQGRPDDGTAPARGAPG